MWTLRLTTNIIVIILIKLVFCDDELSRKTVEVTLKQGVLSGTVKTTLWQQQEYYSFQGIPYAEPPVGERRFLPPKPLKQWDGIYEAHEVKPTCAQFSSRNRNYEPFGFSGSEDCLYISVFTPNLDGNKPVIVFDYNDNFRTGFNGTDVYFPDFFVEEDVIVVIITHRIGVLGYLTTMDEVIPANNGLKDFILGLRWIQENIKKFGGDSKRVTLMGNRGGAVLAEILLYSKAANGLFSAVMVHSGTAMESTFLHDNARQKSFDLGAKLNLTSANSRELLEKLQEIPAETLLTTEIEIYDSEEVQMKQITVTPFGPVVEDDQDSAIITALPEKANIVNDVPVLIGLTSMEGYDLISDLLLNPKIFVIIKDKKLVGFHFPIRVDYRFNPNSFAYKKNVTQDILNFYYGDEEMNFHNMRLYAEFRGDMTHAFALNRAAKKLAKDLESPVYYFMFDFRGALNENFVNIAKRTRVDLTYGATVTDELCYLFVCSRIRKNYLELEKMVSEQPEQKVVKKMVRMWTNFIKMRNPTPEKEDLLKGVTWKPVDKNSEDVDYLHINKLPKMRKNPLGKREQFWDELLKKYAELAENGVVGEGDDYFEEEEIEEADVKKHETEPIPAVHDPNDVISLADFNVLGSEEILAEETQKNDTKPQKIKEDL